MGKVRPLLRFSLALGLLGGASRAAAQAPVLGTNPEAATEPAKPATEERVVLADKPHGELAGLPAIAGNDTFGFLFGVTGSYTRFAPDYAPFRFRAQIIAVTSVRGTDSGVRFPLQNVDVRLDFPGLLQKRLRVFTLLRYQRIFNVGYWGIGNNARGVIPADYAGPPDRFFTYEKQLAELRMFTRYRLIGQLELVTGVGVRFLRPVVVEDSQLERDLRTGGPASELLYGYTSQELVDALVGILLDTRDDELNPMRGQYHELSVRGGAGASSDRNIHYAAIYLHGRWFVPLVGEKLVLALRGLGDLGFGRMPLVELGTIGGYTSIPGPGSIEANRGLPYGRQLGRVKMLYTIELRSTFLHFTIKGRRFALGAATFVDASRVWAHAAPEPALDRGGPFLRFSFGGGPRLMWGRGLVLRGDVGVSPRADIDRTLNVSGSLALGHIF